MNIFSMRSARRFLCYGKSNPPVQTPKTIEREDFKMYARALTDNLKFCGIPDAVFYRNVTPHFGNIPIPFFPVPQTSPLLVFSTVCGIPYFNPAGKERSVKRVFSHRLGIDLNPPNLFKRCNRSRGFCHKQSPH